MISRFEIPWILTSSIIAFDISADSVVVIPAYVGTILPFKLSLSTVRTPPFDDTPSRYAKSVPVAAGALAVMPILTENDVRLRFSVTTKSPL